MSGPWGRRRDRLEIGVPAALSAEVAVERGSFALRAALSAEPGELLAIVGPNGSGKSTLLRALAGLEPLVSGEISLGGMVLDDPAIGRRVPPHRRPVGLIAQGAPLLAHLDVAGNVAFACTAGRRAGRQARAEAAGWLDRFGVSDLAGRRPHELSAGQAQRVALARALATEPRLLLLDEPMSALDVSARPEVRRLLLDHLGAFEGVTLLVTHDPDDAFGLAARVVVLEDGTVTQAGRPSELAARPATEYVADLVGVNLLTGTSATGLVTVDGGGHLTVAGAPDGRVAVVIHPRAVALHLARPSGTPRNVLRMSVAELDMRGATVRVRLDGGPLSLVAEVTAGAAETVGLLPGVDVWAAVKATEIRAFPAG